MLSIIYIVLAIVALGFLVFIHELGHYYVARWVGMRVETFSIGFGKPIKSWTKDGVEWQIGWLPFGGYVKIAGMEKEGDVEPQDIEDGFFGKGPLDRMKVAFAGPIVNIAFALIVFSLIWLSGGREKSFSDLSKTVGWVDKNSEIYAKGVRPGDQIETYGKYKYRNSGDHFAAPMFNGKRPLEVTGYRVDYLQGKSDPFTYTVTPYSHPFAFQEGLLSTGILASANYMYFPGESEGLDFENSPMFDSGIEEGDRIVWADGQMIFSAKQLERILNDGRVLLTVRRGNGVVLVRTPKVPVSDLKLSPALKEEIADWGYEISVKPQEVKNLAYIPYDIDSNCKVETVLSLIDKEDQLHSFPQFSFSDLEGELRPGDQIIAVDGKKVNYSYELLDALQKPRSVHLIVDRREEGDSKILWKDADKRFKKRFFEIGNDLKNIAATVGTNRIRQSSGTLRLLNPVEPKLVSHFITSPEKKAEYEAGLIKQKKEIGKIEDPIKKERALQQYEEAKTKVLLGVPISDQKVIYNPGPLTLFADVIREIYRTFRALIGMDLSPKWMAGPIGIVHVVQSNLMLGLTEALFWIGAISLNLGMLNLLPVPVLDGGYILLSIFELITGKRMKSATMEKLVIPFAVLLIGFIVYVTFHDLSRIIFRILG